MQCDVCPDCCRMGVRIFVGRVSGFLSDGCPDRCRNGPRMIVGRVSGRQLQECQSALEDRARALREQSLTNRVCKPQPVRMRACVVVCSFLVGLPYLSEPTRERDGWVLALVGIVFQPLWPHESRALSRRLLRHWCSYNALRLTPVKASAVFSKWFSESLV